MVDVGDGREDAAAQWSRLDELARAEQVCALPDPSFAVRSDQPILLPIHIILKSYQKAGSFKYIKIKILSNKMVYHFGTQLL